ncbi:MAG TPA: helicase-related protein [Burkholderiaceae bacterium]
MHARRQIVLFFLKSADIPPGARWITVHPHGEGKGQPVLVQPVAPGSATVHVIGGAGGKLNYLKLTGVKSAGAYAKESAERAKERRAAAAEQRRKDVEQGVAGIKKAARKEVAAKKQAAERDFIHTVAEAMGWEEGALAFDEAAHADLSDAGRAKAGKQHHRTLLAAAREAVQLQRKRLLIDADARRQAFTGDMPLHTDDATQLSAADLDPVRGNQGLGFDPQYRARAAAAGLTPDEIDTEKAAVKSQGASDGVGTPDVEPPERPGMAQKIKAELDKVNAGQPDLRARLVDVKQAVALLKAQKQLAAIERSARAANAAIDRSVEPQAYVLESAPASDADIEKDIGDKVRTLQTRAFLAAVSKRDPQGTELEHQAAAGAFNAINALSLAAGGDALLDRSVVDVLGAAAAAQILARRLHTDLGEERVRDIADAVADYHVQRHEELSVSALTEVAALQEQAAAMEFDPAADAEDILVKAELNRKRMEALGDADKVLGRALGEMEANAALVMALRERPRDAVPAALGNTPLASAIKQLRAIGLKKGDYLLEKAGAGHVVTIAASGMERLAQPVDQAGIARVRRNLAIMNGAEDEEDWLPKGFANRADLALKLQPGVAESIAEPFAPGADLTQALRDHIGSRTADGDMPADILCDLQSADYFHKVGIDRAAEYRTALDQVAPNKQTGGKQLQRAEELAPLFNGYADDFVKARWGGTRSALNSQTFAADELAQEALHRALSAEPTGVAAYKQIGELHDGDRRALRSYFQAHVAKESPEQARLRTVLEQHLAQEPDKSVTDLFGETMPNPSHQAWESARMELDGKLRAGGLTWPDYAKAMRGQNKAYAAIQDLVRSKVSSEFARHYSTLAPGQPLKLGKTVIRGNLNHLDAVDPKARDARLRSADKLEAAGGTAFQQAQMGFFSDAETPTGHTPLGPDERHTLGQAAENTLAAMMEVSGRHFVPGQPVKLFHASMSGKDGIKRQRAIKFIKANKRAVMGLGVGSGKTGIGLGAFADLHSEGKIKKGVFVVPSIVQGQFGAEALRFLQPGKFRWHCQPGATHAERLASYKDTGTHFHVVTHQSFRDDILKIAAGQEGATPDAIAAKLDGMGQAERKAYVKAALDKEGIAFDYAMADEGHGLLNREGKENSRMSNAVQGVTDNADYYVHASGDPVKNDASEAFDLLAKMDAARYRDRAAFMRRYGGDTVYAQEGLRRELARHAYTARIAPDVNVSRHVHQVELTEAQRAALDAVDRHAAAARIARMTGGVDVAALKALSPDSFGADEAQHEAVAQSLTKALGVIKNAAINRVLNAHPDSGKLGKVAELAQEHSGRPGVVFARSLEAVGQIKACLEADGHRVIVVTGKDSSKEKAAKIRAFNPDSGPRKADIVVCSDAGAVGANLQSGSWLAQFDTPDTAMVHAQRAGRIDRIGQQNNIDLHDLVANHVQERRSRARLARKSALREVVTNPLDGLDDTGLAAFLFHKQQQSKPAPMC